MITLKKTRFSITTLHKRQSVILCVIFLILIVPSAYSQTEKHVNFITKGLENLREYLDSSAVDGIDLRYVSIPQKGGFAELTFNSSGTKSRLYGSLSEQTYDVNVKSKITSEGGFALGYRSLSVDYSWKIASGYSSNFELSWFENSWGVSMKYGVTNELTGNGSHNDKLYGISKGSLSLKNTHVDGYLIFSPKRFSMPAVLSSSYLQLRNTGSLMAYGSFDLANMSVTDRKLSSNLNCLSNIEIEQIALGLGYGYNFVTNNQKLMIHASFIPLLVIHNNNNITSTMYFRDENGNINYDDLELSIRDKIIPEHKVNLSTTARLMASYNFNDRFYLMATGLFRNLSAKSKDQLNFSLFNWQCNISAGIRF